MQIAISKLSWLSNAIHSPMSSSLLKSSGSVLRSSIARFWTLTPFRVRSPFTITYLKEDICLIRSFGQQYFKGKNQIYFRGNIRGQLWVLQALVSAAHPSHCFPPNAAFCFTVLDRLCHPPPQFWLQALHFPKLFHWQAT